MSRLIHALFLSALLSFGATATAAPEQLEIDKDHTFVTFKVSHIGFAWIPGAFTKFDGELSYDPDDRASSEVTFTVDVPSLDTWHAERDKHLKSDDFLDAQKFPTARFVSSAYEPTGEDTALLRGELTLHDVTREVEFTVNELAGREDPWGNFRRAWEAETELKLADFGIDDFGGAAETAKVKVAIEATRK